MLITGVNDTGDKWTILTQEVFSYFFEMLLGCCYTHKMIFYLMFTLSCRQADFVASVSSSVSMTPEIKFVIARDKLLPVSLLPAISYRLCCSYQGLIITGGVVSGDKLTTGVIGSNPWHGLITGVNDTGDNLSPVTMTPLIMYHHAVSTTPAINTKLLISLQICIKIWNGPHGILRGLG